MNDFHLNKQFSESNIFWLTRPNPFAKKNRIVSPAWLCVYFFSQNAPCVCCFAFTLGEHAFLARNLRHLRKWLASVQMSKRECNCVCLDPVQGFDLVFRFSVCVISLITDVVQYCHVHVRIRRTVPWHQHCACVPSCTVLRIWRTVTVQLMLV